MTGEQELVALLYRADWTRLSLSGTVRGVDEPTFSMLSEGRRARRGEPSPPPPPFPPFSFGSGKEPGAAELTVLLAPGKRYREENPDGSQIRGCDGARIWLWVADPPTATEVRLSGIPQPPFPLLLAPCWLLGGYQLSIEGETTTCGRTGVRVVAERRRNARERDGRTGRSSPGWPLIPPLRWASSVRCDHVACVVDTELGILLRCELVRGDRSPDVTEFVELTTHPNGAAKPFCPPPGSIVGDGSESAWSFFSPGGGVGREAVLAATGLAAGGLGAAIRYSRLFTRSRRGGVPDDDPDAAMPPDDDPVLSAPPTPEAERAPWATAAAEAETTAPEVTDELLHLLYRGGAGNPEFSGTLHRWFEFARLLEAVPDTARKAGFGGVGFLVDTIADVTRDAHPGAVHMVRGVRMGGWERYRIDLIDQTPSARDRDREEPGGKEPHGAPPDSEQAHGEPPDGEQSDDEDRDEPLTVACDGQQRWRVFDDHVVVGPPGPPPDEILDLLDGSWLLGCGLSGGEEIVVGGRRAFRVRAADRHQPWFAPAAFSSYYFPLAAVVDAESGRLLRVTWYKGGKPVSRHELRDVAAGTEGDFGFEVPAGLRVVKERARSAGSQSPGWESPGWESPGWESVWLDPGSAGEWWQRADEATVENPMGSMAKAAADAVKKRVDEKAAAARAFIESLSGRKPPPPAE
jgi:hypothetical protein